MKPHQLKTTPYKFLRVSFLMLLSFFTVSYSFAQVDHYYGLNKKGLRISAGGGFAVLATHYHSNPAQLMGVGRLDYDFNPYFTIGLEAQAGKLKGVDDLHHLYYKTATNNYLDANVNVRVAVGLFYDFQSNNALQDALKRIYVGAGIGRIHTDNTYTYNDDLAPYQPESTMASVQAWSFPFNFGTNIDLPGVLGLDRLSINPNFQFSYVNSYYLDGYRTSLTYSHLKGFYNATTVSLKYKF